MRKFFTVLRYELKEYLQSKGFLSLTLILTIAGVALMFLPRFIDLSDFTGVGGKGEGSETVEESKEPQELQQMIYLDEAGIVDVAVLEQFFEDTLWVEAKSTQEVQKAVEEQTAEAGFVVKSPTQYDYFVYNKSMSDTNSRLFEQAMKLFYRMDYCAENGLDFQEITAMYDVPVTVNEQVLNKDTGSNYWYCYVLVIIVFMLISLYGQMIATSVTSEKSNRAIEVLVTSTSPNSLLFGKVIAGAIGGLVQTGVILGGILIAYEVNREQWGGMLDMLLHIPAGVLITFAFFGLGGYLFYAFLYGAMGALVSKTEDVSKSSSGLMIITMVVYFFSLVQLQNVEGAVIKVLSFLPISSYSTMFARIAMGTVAPWEIVVSMLILVVSILGAGFIGAKLYRMGTLRYGNPIKITTALQDIRKSKDS
ncbi:MAG: ABC transporter permease [Lachnospiraceae bacterium]|nr:ABC transporter permease [Lachnospiraceae bacterium]